MNGKSESTGGVEPTLMQHAGREAERGRKGRAGTAREDRTGGASEGGGVMFVMAGGMRARPNAGVASTYGGGKLWRAHARAEERGSEGRRSKRPVIARREGNHAPPRASHTRPLAPAAAAPAARVAPPEQQQVQQQQQQDEQQQQPQHGHHDQL